MRKTSKHSHTSHKSNIKQAIRKLVWHHYIGYKNGIARCWCCNVTQITPFDFECGHVLAKSKGGQDTIKNLRPICGLCNRSMGSQHMYEFQKEHGLPKGNSYWYYFMKIITLGFY